MQPVNTPQVGRFDVHAIALTLIGLFRTTFW
jgi:hypothetical protein